MLKVYNTLTRKLEVFKTLKEKEAKFFVCGVTPYDYSHLGHAKTYTQFDIIVKYLKYKGYNVYYLQNITDMDDKIIKKANEQKVDWKDISRKYEKEYIEDMKNLGNDSVNKYARATDYMKEIVSQVKRLIEKGYAYKISDGWYFDLSKDKDYGKLAKRTSLEGEDAVSRIDENTEKRNKGDFCLLKISKPGEPYWEVNIENEKFLSRPGWHIEDTAITEKELGQQYDIHGGGIDLIFPHHEAEIAQMESISGKKPFVKYWMHTGFVNVNKDKMSKSLGNFLTIKDVLKRYNKYIIRFLFLQTHYRKPIDFSEEALEQAKKTLQKLNEFMISLESYKNEVKDNNKVEKLIEKTKKNFEKEMDNDFDTHNGITVIFEFVKEVNKMIGEKNISNDNVKQIINFMREIDKVFGILEEKSEIPKNIIKLAEERQEARKKKDYKTSDKIREELKKLGYYLDDKEEGYVVKRL
ncbi:MAG: cysteine--tRNA ligase [Nanoarchaeota archaeon]